MTGTLVLGIGNTLLSDEGVGVEVVHFLRNHCTIPAGVSLLDGGTLSFTLTETIQRHANLVVVDAAQLGAPAGTVCCFEDEAMDEFLGNCKRSAHEVGLLDLMDIARLTDSLPRHRALVAIQPGSIDWGTEPTAAVGAAIPEAASQVEKLLHRWQQAAEPQEACA